VTEHQSTSLRPQRNRRLLAAALALIVSAGVLTSCESTDAERAQVLSLINSSRAAAGLAPVADSLTLDMKADAWAQKLRDECALSHSRLADGAPSNWQKLGENVGYGGSISQVHTAYLNSPGHRANIMDPAFNEAGTAAVWGTCSGQQRVFTVQVFMKS
jgi:uncharacterized protein YkwD